MATDTRNQGSSRKYTEAVSGARADAKPAEETAVQVLSKEAQAMILRPSDADIAALMNDDSLEFAPQVKSLEEGELIVGVLEGRGPAVEFTQEDPFTKQMVTRLVDTWIIRSPSGTLQMSILSSVQLDKKLPPFKGSMVKIYRGKEIRTNKGYRVTEYLVAGPKRADGKARSWIQKDVPIDAESRTIDGPDRQSQIPAGAMPGSAPVAGGEDAQA